VFFTGDTCRFTATVFTYSLMPKPSLLPSLLIATLAALTGCQSVPLDPTRDMVAVYSFGEFRMLLNTNAPTATPAIQKALLAYDLYITKTATSAYQVEFTARARNDQKVTVLVEEINSRQSMLHIRWGAGGNKPNSLHLYELIEKNLAH
jgi:hypothetical protein